MMLHRAVFISKICSRVRLQGVRNMVITRQNLTLLLNMDLELEEAAAIQYIHHASMLTGVVYRNIAGILKVFAFRKLKHAMILTEMIHELGGRPSTRMGNIHIADDNEQMLWQDLDDEQDAIRRCKVRIEQAEQLREMNLAKRLWTILRMQNIFKNTFCPGQVRRIRQLFESRKPAISLRRGRKRPPVCRSG